MQFCLPLANDLGASGCGRDIEKEELAPAFGIDVLNNGLVMLNEFRDECADVLFGVAATDAASSALAG